MGLLFDKVIFGPVMSRRLGVSLGINLLPEAGKTCNFNCVYCECGLNFSGFKNHIFPPVLVVKNQLNEKLKEMSISGRKLDAITFAGNGEPTLHPEFSEVIDVTVEARNLYFPKAAISVLSNSTMLGNEKIISALMKTDKCILKLDSGISETIKKINRPGTGFLFEKVISQLKKLENHFILQTMFLSGKVNGEIIDNTDEVEVDAWLKVIEEIHPKQIMIYSIHRIPPYDTLKIIPIDKLNEIAERARKKGFDVMVV